ncbi:MAG: hypothetical protein OXP74_02680 [Acidobacteriota bacterium]|nr:hypothetical protein [Acidobacteriota bacterium]
MRLTRQRNSGYLVAGLAAALALFGGAVSAQRLWTVEEVLVQPVPPAVMDGMAVSTAVAGAPTAEAAAVQVQYDYLRLGMGHLELPLPDGSVIEAENAVFENRGDGNLLWTGEVPGAGYESVLFTVQDGHLIGWFGEPGEPKYVVQAGPDGLGTVMVEEGPTGDWCGTEMGRSDSPSSDQEVAAASTDSVPAVSRSDTLNILILYTGRTERLWRSVGGAAVGVQQMEDYLNMVFRNGVIPAAAKLIPVRWEPTALSDPLTQAGHREPRFAACFRLDRGFLWPQAFQTSAEVDDLRRSYAADAIYFVTSVPVASDGIGLFNGFQGRALQRTATQRPYIGLAWGVPDGAVLAHEIGHTLGGWHSPYEYERAGQLEWARANAIRPYAFGHTDLDSCGPGGCPGTVMVQSRIEAADKRGSGLLVYEEPYFSSVRYRPNGWTIGVAGERENERVMQETVPAYLRNSETANTVGRVPYPIAASWIARDRVRVTWPAVDPSGWSVRLAAADGANEVFRLEGRSGNLPIGSSENVVPIVEEGRVGAEIGGLRPGALYKISVVGASRRSSENEWVIPLASDVLELEAPSVPSGAPAAPTQVGAQLTGPSSLRLTWSDNSRVETGHEVWYRRWSGSEPDLFWRRHANTLASDTRSTEISGLVADEKAYITFDELWGRQETELGRYTFIVVAFNERGFSASHPFDFEFMPAAHPEATDVGENSDCWPRDTGLDLDGYVVHMCLETPDGTRLRAWDYGLAANQSGLLHFFGRDNVEVLVKVLDGCAINGHRWVFVAPVTTLAFRLKIRRHGRFSVTPHSTLAQPHDWYYDSELRPQEQIDRIGRLGGPSGEPVGNPQGRTARTVSDTTAFPCAPAEIVGAKATAAEADGGHAAFLRSRGWTGDGLVPARRVSSGARSDCEPDAEALTLADGYKVSLCYETYAGETGEALDFGLDSSQSGLLYFFERDNAEVLIKVLDGCGVNGHRWVFVAPVTDLAFNLVVESPEGQRWTHANGLGQPADAASDVSAFPCAR